MRTYSLEHPTPAATLLEKASSDCRGALQGRDVICLISHILCPHLKEESPADERTVTKIYILVVNIRKSDEAGDPETAERCDVLQFQGGQKHIVRLAVSHRSTPSIQHVYSVFRPVIS